jgi:hypothetical protein
METAQNFVNLTDEKRSAVNRPNFSMQFNIAGKRVSNSDLIDAKESGWQC